jgi:WD40 repeat protein
MLNALRPTRRCKTPVYTVAISPDASKYLWAGGSPGADCSLSVSSVTPDKVLHTLPGHKKPVVRARFLEDGSVVSFSFDSHVCRWTVAGDLAASNKRSLPHRADGFAVSKDGNLAVIGDYRGEISGWNLRDGSQSFAFKENSRGLQIWSLALAPDGKRMISGGAGGVIRAWGTAKQRQEVEVDLGWGHHIQGLAWHPDGSIFAAAIAPDGAAPEGSKSRVTLFDGSTAAEVKSLFPDGHQPLCCAFSADGQLLAAAGGGNDRGGRESKANCVIHVWDVTSSNEVATLSGHAGLVRDLAFTSDSRWLLSAGWDNTVRSWQLAASNSPSRSSR